MKPRVSESDDKMCHQRLPMGDEEQVIAVYRHHWFAYAVIIFLALAIDVAVLGFVALLISQGGENNPFAQYQDSVVAVSFLIAILVLLFSLIPLWLRSQEKLILTDEAIYQTLQPNLFSSKISQLNLAHLADVTSRQDFFGTIFGFGHLTVETPGEQDNYEFYVMKDARVAAKEIIETHENFQAALESGRLPTTFRGRPAVTTGDPQAPLHIDPEQYQQFLAFQRMQQQAAQQPEQPQTNQSQQNNQQ